MLMPAPKPKAREPLLLIAAGVLVVSFLIFMAGYYVGTQLAASASAQQQEDQRS